MSVKKFFRVTPEENKIIVANAEAVGLEVSSYMRIQILGTPKIKRYRRVRADWLELRRCMGVINKAGNVVNQLVLTLRRVGGCTDLANAALIELSRAGRAIIAALNRN